MSENVRPGEHRRARHRERAEAVDQALLDVLGQPERGHEPAERDRLHDDARHQEVDVVERARVDRAAEHVDEQQHEHDRLDRVRDQQVRLARDPHAGCGARARACPTRSSRASSCVGLLGDLELGAARLDRGGVAGERDEHVVERRPVQRRCRRSRRSAASSRRTTSAIMPRCECTGALTVRPSTVGRSTHISASAETARSASAASSSTTSSRSPPIWAFSSSAVPSAITSPWSITTIRSASRSASSRYCVVSSTVVPWRHAALDRLPQREPAARVEARGRLVEEQHRRAVHERGGEVEPAAHAAGVGLDGPLGGLRRARSARAGRRRARAPPCAACGRAGRPSRGSRSRSGSRRRPRTGRRARSWRAARPRRARRRAPRRARCPRRASSSVARIRTAVVLPAPFGPSRPSTLPRAARRSRRRGARAPSRRTSASPSTTIASSVIGSKLASELRIIRGGCPHLDGAISPRTVLSCCSGMTTFADLRLSDAVLSALRDVGYESPSPIQEQAIPELLAGRDVIGQAQTGTGKTAAFGLPMLDFVDPEDRDTQALVLTPTRELCIQVTQALRTYGKYRGVDPVAVFGGAPIRTQQAQLKQGAQIVVGTVGRVLDLLSRHSLVAALLPLPRARRGRRDARPRLPRGRREDPRHDAERPPDRAVQRDDARPRSARWPSATCYDPVTVKVKSATLTIDTVEQFFVETKAADKTDMLARVLEAERPDQAIVFVRTKIRCEQLYRTLRDRGMNVKALHGDMSQGGRDGVMISFKGERVQILVATDVAAARARHLDRHAHHQLRRPDLARRLRAPDRAHRPRRALGPRDHVRRAAPGARAGRDRVDIPFRHDIAVLAPDQTERLQRGHLRGGRRGHHRGRCRRHGLYRQCRPAGRVQGWHSRHRAVGGRLLRRDRLPSGVRRTATVLMRDGLQVAECLVRDDFQVLSAGRGALATGNPAAGRRSSSGAGGRRQRAQRGRTWWRLLAGGVGVPSALAPVCYAEDGRLRLSRCSAAFGPARR